MDFKHIPVLPTEVVQSLKLERGGMYVDGTLGGGGHSKLILDAMPQNGRIVGIDRDENAIAAATLLCGHDQRFTAEHDNFHNMPAILASLNIHSVDGILLDLGVSSHQLDTAERGFSYRFDGPLDMRMDTSSPITAASIVNTYSEKDLTNLFFTYGEERHSRRISHAICAARTAAPIQTTLQLAQIIERATPKQKYGQPHPAMRTFMAIRIAVNDELSPLHSVLPQIIDCLAPGGRICIITFHSLEDRIVKSTFQKIASPCDCPRDIPYCVCGKTPGLRIITKKPILPTQEELHINGRAHSAKLRVAERI